jgi:hypothetical protein
VRLGIGGGGVVKVVGRDEADAERSRHLHLLRRDPALLGEPMILELDPVVPGAEDFPVLGGGVPSPGVLSREQQLGQLRGKAAREARQPLGVLGEQLLVHPGPVVEPLEVRRGHELQQVPVPDLVACEERQVVVLLLVLAGLAVEPRARCHVGLDAEDGLDAVGMRRLVEAESAEHHPVVGDGDRGHVHPLGFREDRRGRSVGCRRLDAGGPVEQRILGVNVQMDETVSRDRGDLRRGVFHTRPGRLWKLTWL